MVESNDKLSVNLYGADGIIVDVHQLDIAGPMETVMEIMPEHMLIILILIILSYFLFGKKDKTTFKIAGLLFYVIGYDIINAYIGLALMDVYVYLHKMFEIKFNNILYFNSIISSIITICLNIILLLPIRISSKYLKLNIDYKKLFLLFSTYLIMSSLYGLLYIQLYSGGFVEIAHASGFRDIGLFVIFLAVIGILPGIISYKIVFYDKVKKVNDII